MRIARLIGFLMVDAVHGDPENRSAFESQRAADGEEVFKPERTSVGTMRMQPVIPMLIPSPVASQYRNIVAKKLAN